MRLVGYHNTEKTNVADILEKGFITRHNEKHWLGQGIYFFDDVDVAMVNIDMLNHEKEVCTIAAEIEVEQSKYLDLDNRTKLNEFRKFCDEIVSMFTQEGIAVISKGKDKREEILRFKCLCLDKYKEKNGYGVVTKTFPKERTPYAETINGVEFLGLAFLERYICVSDNEYITKKNVVERELIV